MEEESSSSESAGSIIDAFDNGGDDAANSSAIVGDISLNQLFERFTAANSIMLYGTSGQGKSHLLRQYLDHYYFGKTPRLKGTTIIMLKNTLEDADKRYYELSQKSKHFIFSALVDIKMAAKDAQMGEDEFVDEFIGKVEYIIRAKNKDKQEYFRGKRKEPNAERFVVIFDDMLAFSEHNRKKLNKLIKELVVQGRHSNIQTWILVQHFISITKLIRSNINMFVSMLPLDYEYVRSLYETYFRKFDDYKTFLRYVRGKPLYSKLAMVRQLGEILYVPPDKKND